MKPILSRCGYRCDLCLAYRPNVEADPRRQKKLSDGWYTYFGFRIPANEIVCDGCWADDGRLIDAACPVRPCVIARGLQNCAQCADQGCAALEQRLVALADVQKHVSWPIPDGDYQRFIRPYENRRRLTALREGSRREPDASPEGQ